MSELFDLKKLAEMRDKGEVTQAEYEKIKAELVADLGDVAPSDESDLPPATPEPATAQPTPSRSRASDAGEWLGGKAPGPGKTTPAAVPSLLKEALVLAGYRGHRSRHSRQSGRKLRWFRWELS